MDKITSRTVSKFYAGFNFLSNSDDSTKEWHEEFCASVNKGELVLYRSENGVEIYYRYLTWD